MASRSTCCRACVPRSPFTASRRADCCRARARRVYLAFLPGRRPASFCEAIVSEELRRQLIRNFDEVEMTTSDRAPLYDGGRTAFLAGARAGMTARKIGCGIDVVPPGKRA